MKIKNEIIQHRINEISSAVSKNDFGGIELDVRTFGNEIVCSQIHLLKENTYRKC